MTEHVYQTSLESWKGLNVDVEPAGDDTFSSFRGKIIGTRHGLLLSQDQDDNVYAVDSRQVTKV